MVELVPGLGNFIMGQFSNIAYWIGYILLIVLIFAILGLGYYYISFPYKIQVIQLAASGTNKKYGIGGIKNNRAKIIKRGNAWKSMFPFMNRKEREPISAEFIYPGKKIYVYEIDGEWQPAKINIDEGDHLDVNIKAIPHAIRNWQEMEHKKNASEFAEHNWWEDNKQLFFTMVVAIACCVLCGVTVYFTFKYAGGKAQDVITSANSLANSLSNINVIQSIPK